MKDKVKKEIKQKQDKSKDYPFYMLIALVVVLPLVFTTTVESLFNVVKSTAFRMLSGLFFISLIIFLWNKLKQNRFEYIANRAIDSAVLFIFLGAVISTVFSINPYVSLFGQYSRQIGLITYAILTLLYFLSSITLSNTEKRDKLLFAMSLTGALVGAYSILQYFGLDPFKVQIVAYVRPMSSMGTSVFAAGLMVMVLPFAVIRAFQNKFSFTTVIIPVIILAGIIISQTRTVYAALLFELILFCIFYPYVLKPDIIRYNNARRTGLIILGIIVIALIAANIFLSHNIYIKRFQSIVTITETQRWVLWKTTLNMFGHYPITGTGISTFSRGLEDFLTIALKNKDASPYYDNAHNNYLHTLAVMGIIGLAAYLYMLFTGVRYSIASVLNKSEKKSRQYIFVAFLCMFGGYIVYGLADFDELTHLAYLFIFLAAFKSELFSAGKGVILKFSNKSKIKFGNIFVFSAAVVVMFSLFNIYDAYVDFKADKVYHEGLANYNYFNGNITELNSKLNRVIELNPRAEYRFSYAYHNYFYCFDNPMLNAVSSKPILKAAEDQLRIAVKNHPSELECLALLSLIKYDEGDTIEAEKLKNEVLAKDTLQTDFRVNLSRYYFKSRKDDLALEQLNIVYKYEPNNVDAYFTSLIYMMKKKEYKSAEECCNAILRIEPKNIEVLKYLNEIKRLKDIKK
ncbi:MAG: hypothetical protein EHM58_10985 [Ignavibacteriae bacterium]|nr:MAG: hypothetical protein EHM58_10985 [Ignavibacteriota bacterium]